MSESQLFRKVLAGGELAAAVVPEIATLGEAEAAFDRAGAGLAVVVDAAGAPRGVLTDAELRSAALRGLAASDGALRAASAEFDVAPPGEPAEAVAARLAASGGSVSLVVQGGTLVEARLAAEAAPSPAFALVLAGGLGTRMGALTQETPKPLIPVAGKPLVEHVLRHLARHGVREATIATNYLAEKVEEHVGCGARYGLRVAHLREERRLGTAGALSLLDPVPAVPFFVVNADVLTRLDLRALARHHRRSGATLTMAVARHVVESRYGVVRLLGTRVVDVAEKPRLEQWVNAGIYVVSPAVARAVPRNSYVDMTTMIERLVRSGETVEAFPIREYWRDAGTPEDLARADSELRSQESKAP